MERTDVLIVGGGPAGSACARALVDAGRDVLVADAAVFPRDKPCAGWITPEVLAEVPLSIDRYAERNVAQPITRFRVGRIGGGHVDVDYGEPVSYGIRRCEFDAELLRASGARTRQGTRIRRIERRDGSWIVDGEIQAATLVGAGGHFCPVARQFGGTADDASVVVAREVEYPLEKSAGCRVREDRPELYFCRDFRGYGWIFRKDDWLNVGLGRLDTRNLAGHLEGFLAFLLQEGRIAGTPGNGWRGHAYRIRQGPGRRVAGDGFLLAGDAAGLAAPASGEGILPAIVSGRLAAEAIVESGLDRYEARLVERFGPPSATRRVPGALVGAVGSALLAVPAFVRGVVVDRWFLHRSGAARHDPPNSPSATRRSNLA